MSPLLREVIAMPTQKPHTPQRDPLSPTPRDEKREPDARTPVRQDPDEPVNPDEHGPLKREDPEVLPDDPDIAGIDGSNQPS